MTTDPDPTSPEDNDTEGGGVSPFMDFTQNDRAFVDDIIRRESVGTPDRTDMGVLQQPTFTTPLDGRAEREQAVRSLHAYVSTTLADKRRRRDMLEDEIRELVGEEYRLGKMVGMIDRAHKKEQEEGDDA